VRSLTPKDIGALVRDHRIEAGLTQAELGAKIGASRFWVAEFERGKPSVELRFVLKAIKAVGLVTTIGPRERIGGGEETEQTSGKFLGVGQPHVDLNSILRKSAMRFTESDVSPAYRITAADLRPNHSITANDSGIAVTAADVFGADNRLGVRDTASFEGRTPRPSTKKKRRKPRQ
jgi:DNA-binding XRE family transcriptional regulator